MHSRNQTMQQNSGAWAIGAKWWNKGAELSLGKESDWIRAWNPRRVRKGIGYREGPVQARENPGSRLDYLNESRLLFRNHENIWRVIKDIWAVATRACPHSASLEVYYFPSAQQILPLPLNFCHTCALRNCFLVTLQNPFPTTTLSPPSHIGFHKIMLIFEIWTFLHRREVIKIILNSH